MTVDNFIAQYVTLPSDLECFENFGLDMTRSQVIVEENGRLIQRPAMQRVAGQKQSERMLWNIGPATPANAAAAAAVEREASINQMAAAYANDPAFELEVDPFTFATGLAKAYRHHTGEMPTFLLDDDGSL